MIKLQTPTLNGMYRDPSSVRYDVPEHIGIQSSKTTVIPYWLALQTLKAVTRTKADRGEAQEKGDKGYDVQHHAHLYCPRG